MAIKKLCAWCGKVIDYGNTYCDTCQLRVDKNKKSSVKHYNDKIRDKESQSFYNSKAWKSMVKIVKQRDNGMCVNCLANNKISYYNVIHHIVEYKEDSSKGLDIDNLVCLCSSCHAIIHGQYNKGDMYKMKAQDKLKQLIRKVIDNDYKYR